MTTKRTFLRLPGQGQTPVKPRIVIEVDPLKGGSSLKTYGPLSIPMVIDALMAQQASLWAQFIKGLTTGVTDPSTGLPAVKSPMTADACPGFEPYTDNTDNCQHCGAHRENHPPPPNLLPQVMDESYD